MKRLEITNEMSARIDAVAGTHVDPATVVAFEAVAVTDIPITKPGNIFNGGTFDPTFFPEMQNFLDVGKSVPVAAMHQTGELPLGRVFTAKAVPGGLRAQFYLPAAEAALIGNIDNGVIGYVSVGVLSKELLCSTCNWDYRGPEASVLNLLDQTCANDHIIGQDGAHLVSKGLDTWFELSLCGTGASPGAAILARSKAALMADNPEVLGRLAASGVAPEAVIMTTTPTGESTMDTKEFTAQLTAKAKEVAELDIALAEATTKADAATTELATAKTALEAANTAKTAAEAKVITLEAKVAEIEPKLTTASDFIKEQAIKALVASGHKPESLPSDLTGMLASITNSGMHLAQLIASQEVVAATVSHETKSSGSNSAFKTRS